MPIDPNISLQAGKIGQGIDLASGVERGMKLQQLAMQPAILEQQLRTAQQAERSARTQEEATRAGIAESQARLPGVQAEAAAKVRGERQANERISAAQSALETDDEGRPIIDPATGQPKFNLAKYQYGLHKAGLVDEALKTGSDALRQSKDVYDFTTNVRNQIAIASQAAYDSAKGTPAQKEKAARDTWAYLSEQAVQASGQGQFPLSMDQFKYTPGIERTLYTASINPQAQEGLKISLAQQDLARDQLALQTAQFDNSRQLSFTDETSQDPNSGPSQRARDIIFRSTGEIVPAEVSASELYRNPKYKPTLENIGAGVGAARQAALGEVTKWESVGKAIDGAKTQLSTLGLKPAQFMENYVRNNLGSNPELARLYAELSKLDPKMVSSGLSFEALKAVSDANLSHAKANVEVSGGGGAPGRTTERPRPGSAPAAAPKGSGRSVTKSDVADFAKETGRSVAEIEKELRGRGVEIK